MAVVVPVRPMAERRVVQAFRDAGAVSMADAVSYSPPDAASERAFARLKGADVLRTNGQGKWWLEEERWDDRRSGRRTRTALALVALAAIAAAALR